jgi:hypothetical protein
VWLGRSLAFLLPSEQLLRIGHPKTVNRVLLTPKASHRLRSFVRKSFQEREKTEIICIWKSWYIREMCIERGGWYEMGMDGIDLSIFD